MPPKHAPAWHGAAAAASQPTGSGFTMPTPKGQVRAKTDQLRAFVKQTIAKDNLLQLPDGEVDGIVDMMMSSAKKAEVFEWGKTLMLPESFALEVIRRREELALYFDDSVKPPGVVKPVIRDDELTSNADDTASVATSAATTASQTAKKKKGLGARGKVVQFGATGEEDALVRGSEFECGCFATTHAFKSNCANCGRIFCVQESDSVCYHCGLEPETCLAYELRVQSGQIDAAAAARDRKLYEAAVARRDQLLTFARERAKRTLVIDDQTGMHKVGAFSTQAERNEALEAERKRISQMHKSSGAYTVHLDIVRQNAQLGAAAVGVVPKLQADVPAPADVAVGTPAPSTDATMPPQAPSEDDDTDDEEDDTRCLPLPTLLQKVYYQSAAEQQAGGKTTITAVKRGKTEAKAEASAAGSAAAPAAHAPTSRSLAARDRTTMSKGHADTSAVASARVQTEYFEDDRLTWRIAQTELEEEERALAERSDGMAAPTAAPVFIDPSAWGARSDSDMAPAATADPSLFAEVGSSSQLADAALSSVLDKLRRRDDGMCLSMHQPWASLLIAGIKSHEGRTWPTDHRGRLWIHAAGARPMHVEDVERQYAAFLGDRKFPSSYPTGCLLGYVVVTECLDRKEYEARFPREQRQESSDFTFVCHEPLSLPVALPMEGKHKIFKLEKKTWTAARKLAGDSGSK